MDEKKLQEAENLAKEIGELEQMSDVENMIKDKEIKFKLEGRETNYRVRMPIYEEQRELENERLKDIVVKQSFNRFRVSRILNISTEEADKLISTTLNFALDHHGIIC